MIGNIVPSVGTYIYLEPEDRKTLRDISILEGKLLGFEGEIHSPFFLLIKNFNNNKKDLKYFCTKEYKTYIALGDQLHQTIDTVIDRYGKVCIPYKGADKQYTMVIADVLKLQELRKYDAITFYETVRQRIAPLPANSQKKANPSKD